MPTVGQDNSCNQGNAWPNLQTIALALGEAQGQSAGQAASNQALSEYTNSAAAQAAGYELKTASNTIPAVGGDFYAVSAYFAEENCTSAQASETFYVVENGTPTALSNGLDPCAAANATTYGFGYGSGDGTAAIEVSQFVSAAQQLPSGGTPSLGLELHNAQANGTGNDVAFDNSQRPRRRSS